MLGVNRKEAVISLIIFFIIALAISVSSAPPTPHSISGYIFLNATTQAPVGIGYDVNNTLTQDYKKGVTNFPIPSQSGYYSESISGTDGDLVIVRAWNVSHYGITNATLQGNTRNVNITLNISRDTEPTVNITSPQDNVLRNDSEKFMVTSLLKLYGSSGTGCNTTISYSNTSVLASYLNQPTTINLGSLASGYTTTINWNITVVGLGSSNVTVNFTCNEFAILKFETLNNTDTVFNITTEDKTGPNITLISPQNNYRTNNQNVTFQYNVTDLTSVKNCSLFIDGVFNQTNTTAIVKGTTLEFNITMLSEGNHTWQVECYDEYGQRGLSLTRNITIDLRNRTISTESPSYYHGQYVRFLGYNWTNSSVVTLKLTRSDFSEYYWNTTTSAGGVLNTTYFLNYSNPTGTYTIFAYEYNFTHYNTTNTFDATQRIQSLITDKIEYTQNENVSITGFNFTMNGTIRVRIFQNSSNATGPGFPVNTRANNSGNFNYTWNTTNTCPGVYGITATDLNYSVYQETVYFNITGGTPCINWGNRAPNVTTVLVDDSIDSPASEIALLAWQTTPIVCNATIKDLDGLSDLISANATFFYYLNKTGDPDDNNTHYSNSSCTETGDNGVDEKYFTCSFNVSYYANNGTWYCGIKAIDTQNAVGQSNDTTLILTLKAINLTPLLDYGELATGSTSGEMPLLISNGGNTEIDVGIDAYGVTDGDGIAMNCTTANISFADERYTALSGTPFASMTSVTDTLVSLSTFNLAKQKNTSLSQKNLYWRVRGTPSSLGDCQGVVVVTAT